MGNYAKTREVKRTARHQRIRKIVRGTNDRPRLCVHRSLKNFYAQLIDDSTGKVLIGMSTMDKQLKTKMSNLGNIKGAAALGEAFAGSIKQKGFQKVCFDRGGYRYHGRVKAFADAARSQGLEF